MPLLPIHDVLPEIKEKLTTHNRLVLQAPPGAGKTTAVPIALLGEGWLGDRQIIMLEPRRLAARNAAARMAFLLGEKVGETVGYQIRQDSCVSDKTKILVVTEGILTRKLQADPELTNTALVIFDEFHERSLHADLSLALCLQSQQILREDLKILVMSATLHTDAVASLLHHAPIIESEGRSFPVENRYLDHAIRQRNSNPQQQLMIDLTNTVNTFIHEHEGNCLVFLPGVKEINQLARQIKQLLDRESIRHIVIAPLHGSLKKQQQDLAIAAPADKGMRKIVLATNIAETSITIEGISCVIDSGLERVLDYSPASGMNRLTTRAISQDSAVQRSGRAGRLSAGTCYRMWSATQQSRLLKHASPEILHSDLTSLVLELANWGVTDVNELQWMDLPPHGAIEQAKTLLQQLGAIDGLGTITAHGRDMLRLGTHPRLAHMMLAAVKLNQAYHACLIASLLSEKDIFLANADKSADIHDRLNVLLHGKSNHHGIDHQQCKRIMQSADDFFRRVKQCSKAGLNKERPDHHYSGVLLAYAYPDRIAKRRNPNEARYLLSNGKGAVIPPYIQHHLHEYLVVANLDARQGEASIYLAADISAEQLQTCFSGIIEQEERVEWNDEAQRVEVKQVSRIGKIMLQESTVHHSDSREAVQQCLLQAIREQGVGCLNWSSKARSLQQRVQFIHHHLDKSAAVKNMFAEQPLPDFSEQALSDRLEDWLQPHLNHENSLKQCFNLDLHSLLLNQLSWQQQQLIKQLAPERISVPSGSAVTIDYSDPEQPVLAVRLQEVFGLFDTPTLLNGACKLTMHLLSPARKPMQVTQDLNSFWQTTYHDVKKELRGKYKRHYWPDDPFTAEATSKTKKQMHRG
ncbi:ATP-dependent helicase HrpB [Mariprofundus ferrooxydans]|uniref:ATP-dependent helicase HrpB n=1 Tax=Mariprofundus ferrooxydans PV-1 TaxID=314345 RepID=Q0EYD3_9PROT|nr:ATP-dependent helicase HrpB [Mariprofundus ferrooxydans]EAU54259.1 ATP-dependent helicase HrpB [Mariprofundus ferrooxydans PV-1]KON47805.1 ATP-dependent helicase HrpB [Mariprofundus ferrooxydans]